MPRRPELAHESFRGGYAVPKTIFKVLLLGLVLLMAGCASCHERYRSDAGGRKPGEKILIISLPN